MADKIFDAVVIGGGTKSLVTALYLQAYGGLKTGLFEDRHEVGGCWHWQDGPAPGFSEDVHATNVWDWYFLPLLYDFPNFEEYGGRFLHYPAVLGIVFKESDEYLVIYHRKYDPTGELTAKEFARYSERDAETFLKLEKAYIEPGGRKDVFLQQAFDLPPAPGQPGVMDIWWRNYLKRPDAVFEERMMAMSGHQAGNLIWDGIPIRCLGLSILPFVASHPNEVGGAPWWFSIPNRREMSCVVGGTHIIAHAIIRLFVENDGEFFCGSEVEKIIIENGQARGIRLIDGTEVKARVVVSGADPYQLCFRFIGEGHLDAKTVRRIANLERVQQSMLGGVTFALNEFPNYKAAKFNSVFDKGVNGIIVGGKLDDMEGGKEYSALLNGVELEESILWTLAHHTAVDSTRAPQGKHVITSGVISPPLFARTEREWIKHRRWLADKILRRYQGVAPNMTWDNVIDYSAINSYCLSKLKKSMPTGNQNVIDWILPQMGKFRPIPEWADHRIPPIKNLYGTGVAWGAAPGANCSQGYTCYKAIAIDHGLRKPWEEKNRPW